MLVALFVISVSFLVCVIRTDWQKESLLAQERSEKGSVGVGVVDGGEGDEGEAGTSEMIEMLDDGDAGGGGEDKDEDNNLAS